MKDTCEFPAFTGYRIQDNIIHLEFKKIKKMTSEDVTNVYECLQKCKAEDGVYLMATFKGYIPLSDEAMATAKKHNTNYVRASAFVIQSSAFRVAIMFFMNFYKPKRTIAIFKAKDEAVSWLKEHKKMNLAKELSLS